MNEDPIEVVSGMNLQQAIANRPVNLIDPLGREV
jgi:hypothetical protein